MTNEISIERSAFLLSIKIRGWTGNKTDRITSDEIVQSKGTDRSAGVFVKRLLGKCEALNALNTMASTARLKIQSMCLPYSVRGIMFVPVKNYDRVVRAVKEEQEEFYKRLDEFKALYPKLVERAREQNKELFREEEIPTVEEIERKFDFDWSVMPIPDPERIDGFFQIPEMEQEIRENMERQNQNLMKQNMSVLKGRIREVAQSVHDKFKSYDGTRKNSFRNKMVEKSLQSVRDSASLNVFEDKTIEGWCNKLEGILDRGSSQWFKSDDAERSQAVMELNQLLMQIGN